MSNQSNPDGQAGEGERVLRMTNCVFIMESSAGSAELISSTFTATNVIEAREGDVFRILNDGSMERVEGGVDRDGSR